MPEIPINISALEPLYLPWDEPNSHRVRADQFERTGYFCLDLDSTPEKLVFNLTVGLKDAWAKLEKKG